MSFRLNPSLSPPSPNALCLATRRTPSPTATLSVGAAVSPTPSPSTIPVLLTFDFSIPAPNGVALTPAVLTSSVSVVTNLRSSWAATLNVQPANVYVQGLTDLATGGSTAFGVGDALNRGTQASGGVRVNMAVNLNQLGGAAPTQAQQDAKAALIATVASTPALQSSVFASMSSSLGAALGVPASALAPVVDANSIRVVQPVYNAPSSGSSSSGPAPNYGTAIAVPIVVILLAVAAVFGYSYYTTGRAPCTRARPVTNKLNAERRNDDFTAASPVTAGKLVVRGGGGGASAERAERAERSSFEPKSAV